jgi:hypothetical protein
MAEKMDIKEKGNWLSYEEAREEIARGAKEERRKELFYLKNNSLWNCLYRITNGYLPCLTVRFYLYKDAFFADRFYWFTVQFKLEWKYAKWILK